MNTDLFVKPTAVNQYLSPQSAHPSHICRNIPFSLGFRLRRICSEDEDFNRQLEKLGELLLARGYRKRMIECAFTRVRALSREYTLEKVVKQPSDKISFVITYDPRLASIPGVLHKHARTLMMDSHMRETFQDGFQVAFKRHRNVKEFLCRARLYDTGLRRNDARGVNIGWRKCEKCTTCKRSTHMNQFVSSAMKKNISDHREFIMQGYECHLYSGMQEMSNEATVCWEVNKMSYGERKGAYHSD